MSLSDSDGEGDSNLVEIDGDAQPGWTSGAGNTSYFSDGSTGSASAPASIGPLDIEPNALPSAHAGGDQSVDEGVTVNLDGSGSTDSDGSIAATGYSWTQTDATGITVTLTGANTVAPSFVAPQITLATSPVDLVFSLIVTDNEGGSSLVADTVTITVNNVNVLPTANAGGDQSVDEGATVNLDGTASADSDGSIAVTGYSWTQTSGTAVSFDFTSATPSFVAPQLTLATTPTDLVFSLIVTDNEGGSSLVADTVTVTVNNVNVLPTANAGGDQSVNEGAAVNLDGSGSTDSDGSIAATDYSWTQTDTTGITVTLTDANTATPSFIAPQLTLATSPVDLIFSLIVTDNEGGSNLVADTVTITVNNVNVLPTANAGGDQTVDEGATVNLDGTSSVDSDGSIAATDYSWTQTDTTGITATLTDANTATPSFVAPQITSATSPTDLIFALIVTDNEGGSNAVADTVTVTVNNVNVLPTANAGGDQSVNEGATINLDGTGSTDSDGSIAATTGYSWTQTDTTGITATLTGANTATPSFVAPQITLATSPIDLIFSVIVTDNDGGSSLAADTVTVTVNNVNVLPTANAGGDQSVDEGATVNLDGSGSADSDGSIAATDYTWTQTDATGITATLTGANTATPSFVAPQITLATSPVDLIFSLIVTDNEGGSNAVADTITVTVNNVNALPTANAGVDQSVNEGDTVNLDGSGSADSDGSIAATTGYTWTQTDTTGISATLTGASTSTPSFVAPQITLATSPIDLIFSLIVTDNEGGSNAAADTVTVTINNVNVLPTANAGGDQSVDEGATVNLDGTGSADSDGSIAATDYSWTQTDTTGITATLTDANTATPSFVAPQLTLATSPIDLIFSLIVTDNEGGSNAVADSITVTVNNVNALPTASAGTDQNVDEGDTVNLDGSGSADSDGSIAATDYTWTQTDATGITAALTGASTATPSFVAPQITLATSPSELIFSLIVTDNEGGSNTVADTITVTVNNVNVSPTANAGGDQSVNEGATVNLDGTGSADSDGSIAATDYSWTQTDSTGITASLTGANTATPSFVAPQITLATSPTELIFSLIVTDNEGASSPAADTITVTVNNVNGLPTASAGTDQNVNEGATVNLDGSGSTDSDGSIAATGYSWTQTDTTGITATLTGANTSTPSFIAPQITLATSPTELIFSLIVTDNEGGSNAVADTVTVTVNNVNVLPTANAGGDQSVNEGVTVNLDGASSADSDGSIAATAYSWTQTDTTGITVTLTGANTATPSFIAPQITLATSPTELIFSLIVTDNEGGSNAVADTVTVTINNVNVLPTANAGGDQSVNEGVTVNLDGTGSTDSDGSIAATTGYNWTQTDTTGITVTITGASTSTPSFIAPQITLATSPIDLVFSLIVTDNEGGSSPAADTITITVNNVNALPIANAGGDQSVNEGATVNLDGSGSTDSDGSIAATGYSWTQTDATGVTATLTGANTATPSFVAPQITLATSPTELIFSLIVTDNEGGSNAVADTVTVTINNVNALPTANAGGDQSVNEGTTVNLDGTGSTDSDGSISTATGYSWTQTDATGVTATLTGASTATPSFVAPQVTLTTSPVDLIFSLIVTDNEGGSSPAADTITVTVSNVNVPPTANAGNDRSVSEFEVAMLDGSASFDIDSDGSVVSYSWTQTDSTGIDALLTGADTSTPSFTAPEITRSTDPTVLTFSLIVTDNEAGISAADTINVSVTNVNLPPTAMAGEDQIVDESSIVLLDGSASFDIDIDGNVASYLWTQISGVPVFMDDETSVTPSFDPPYVNSDNVLEFSMVAIDNEGAVSVEDMVTITVTNVAVDAGVDQQVNEGDIVRLNGLNSLSINGEISGYRWTQLEGPNVVLMNRSNPLSSFIAPEVSATTLLVFELEVVGGSGARDYDTVFINVRDELLTSTAPPLDVQLGSKSVASGGLYQFGTTGAFGPDVIWNQISGPEVTLVSANTETPSFTAPIVPTDSSAVFEVRSTDLDGRVVRADVNVNILESASTNAVPVAQAGDDQIVIESDTVFLDAASASTDPDGSIFGYHWHQTSGPMVALSSIISSRPTFLAPAIAVADDGTTLTFEVIVIDRNGFVDRDSVTVTVMDNGISGFSDDLATLLTSTGDSIAVETGNFSNLIGLEAVDPSSIVDNVNRPAFLAYGLIDFGVRVVPGFRARISFTLPAPAPADFTWWKYSTTDGWRDYGASFNATRDVVTISITDNTIGDDDPALGVIRDPGGLGPAPPIMNTTEPNASNGSSGGGGSAGPWLLLFLLLSALIAISRSNHQIRQQGQ